MLLVLCCCVTFILAGANGLDPANWMQQNLARIGNKSLKEICIPGSHNAGLSKKTGGTGFASKCNTLTQSRDIKAQLELGARYFDIRPVIAGGKFGTGHYSYVGQLKSWQGANGQTMEEIINNINDFTSSHKELVILALSHSMNTDVGNKHYRKFDDGEWERLFNQMMRLNHRFDGNQNDLIHTKINTMITNKPSVIILVDGANYEILNKFKGKGVFHSSSLRIFDKYSDTNKLEHMANDQINKLRSHSNPNQLFLLSWTLTQPGLSAALCTESITKLANKANRVLTQKIQPEIAAGRRPNIILLDNISDGQAAALSVACSTR